MDLGGVAEHLDLHVQPPACLRGFQIALYVAEDRLPGLGSPVPVAGCGILCV